jgi:hypothetical protein
MFQYVVAFFVLFMPLAQAQTLYAQNMMPGASPILMPSQFSVAAITPEPVAKNYPQGGQNFKFNGKEGVLALYSLKNGTALGLTLSGKTPMGEKCQHNLTPELSRLTPVPRNTSVPRFYAKLQGCDIFVDVLGDAVFVQAGICKPSSQCQLETSGIWSLNEAALPEDKAIDKAQGVAEKKLQTARLSLTKKLKDHYLRDFISEQVDFNANRLRLCAGFESEASINFCVLKRTEMRVAELEERLATR